MCATLRSKSNMSENPPPIIMNRSVSTTLQNLLDLIFRDLVESSLTDVTVPGINSTKAIK